MSKNIESIGSANKIAFLLCHNVQPISTSITQDSRTGKDIALLNFVINEQEEWILNNYFDRTNPYVRFINSYNTGRNIMQDTLENGAIECLDLSKYRR